MPDSDEERAAFKEKLRSLQFSGIRPSGPVLHTDEHGNVITRQPDGTHGVTINPKLHKITMEPRP